MSKRRQIVILTALTGLFVLLLVNYFVPVDSKTALCGEGGRYSFLLGHKSEYDKSDDPSQVRIQLACLSEVSPQAHLHIL